MIEYVVVKGNGFLKKGQKVYDWEEASYMMSETKRQFWQSTSNHQENLYGQPSEGSMLWFSIRKDDCIEFTLKKKNARKLKQLAGF